MAEYEGRDGNKVPCYLIVGENEEGLIILLELVGVFLVSLKTVSKIDIYTLLSEMHKDCIFISFGIPGC